MINDFAEENRIQRVAQNKKFERELMALKIDRIPLKIIMLPEDLSIFFIRDQLKECVSSWLNIAIPISETSRVFGDVKCSNSVVVNGRVHLCMFPLAIDRPR